MLLIVAWATSVEVNPLSLLANYGFGGVMLGLVMTGQFHTKSETNGLETQLAQAREDGKSKDAAMAALIAQLTSRTMPTLEHITQVIDALPSRQPVSTESALLDQLKALTDRIDQIDKRSGGR